MDKTAAGGTATSRWFFGAVAVPYRLPMLILGFVSAAIGVGAGLARLGFGFPLPSPGLVSLHGPLMVSGFLGTLISLERAVALDNRWAYGGPFFGALGAAALLLGAPVTAGALLLSLASLFLTGASAAVFRRQRAVFTGTLLLGAAGWLAGNLFWLAGAPLPAVVPWWSGFLVLTIAGERLELSRFLAPPAAAQRLFAVIVSVLIAGIVLGAMFATTGSRILAVGLLALTLWLARYDIARRTVRERGLTRFTAVCLLSGYVWLGVGAIVMLVAGGLSAGPVYDAALHATFLGFVFSMVFGHAPIILPAVTHLAMRYHPVFYAHLALLHASLALRLAGDLAGVAEWRALGALLNAIALLVFVLNTVAGIVRGRRSARSGA